MDNIKNIVKNLSLEQRIILSLMVFDAVIIVLSRFR